MSSIELPFLDEEFKAPWEKNPPPSSFYQETMNQVGGSGTVLRRTHTDETIEKIPKGKDKENSSTRKLKRISRSFRNGPESRKSKPGLSFDDVSCATPPSFSRPSPASSPCPSPSPSPILTASEGTSIVDKEPVLSARSRKQQPSKFKIDDQFCVEDTPDNIIFDEDGTIKAATVEKLVQRVTFETNPDPKLVEDFLLTYRSFITPEKLMELLKARFNTECPPNLSPEEQKQFQSKFLMPVRVRVFNLCKNWVKFYNADFLDDESLAKEFEKWIKGLFDKKKCEDLKNILKSAKDQHAEQQQGEETSKKKKKNARETQKPKPFLPASEKSGAQSMLDFHPTEVARQICLLEMTEYRKIRPWELLNQGWSKETGNSPHVRKMISGSTRISQLISTEIIKVPIKKKTGMIAHCIHIASELMKLNNYNGVMSILAGFSNSAVNRLQPFFRDLSKKEAKQLAFMRAALSSDKNFREMRDIIKTAEPPILPYLGTFLTDLTFIEDGNQDRVGELVNFRKCRLQCQVIRLLQQYQQINYHLEAVPQIQKFLTTGMIMENKVLYQVSLKHLPREAKEVTVKELERLKKSKTGAATAGSEEKFQFCPGTMKFEDVVSAIENDDDLTIVSLCCQNVSKKDMETIAALLETHENIHTLRLCHGAYADRSLREGWKWLKKATHIKTFDLSNQDLAFLPDEIAYLGKLTSLSIAHNAIESIPRAIAYLDKLEELKCEGNKIKEIPDSVQECKKLRSFNISTNKLTALPEFLAWLGDLKYFYCNDNDIKSIPSELLQKGGQELLQHLRGGEKPAGAMGLGFAS